jgi:large subunit ribosomal protein L13
MENTFMKTPLPKVNEIEHKWYVVDAKGETLGRLATQIATRLRGKHKPIFTPHLDTGDFIIVINASQVRLTGNKATEKPYKTYTGFTGGLKIKKASEMLAKRPEDVIKLAVKRMLPKNTLGGLQFKKLKVYAGSEHPHASQLPEKLQFTQ